MRIVCVHQGYELYGSDRCFIDSVAALREAWPQAEIEVVLPREGPIAAPLRALASRVSIEPLFILRRRGLKQSNQNQSAGCFDHRVSRIVRHADRPLNPHCRRGL